MSATTPDLLAVVNRQRAFVRALRDELGHYSPAEEHATALWEQLCEEETRLAALLGLTAAA